MTSNQLTRERLEKIKSWREIYGAGSNVMLPAEEAEELAGMALAAMDSEPVAYTEKHEISNMHATGLYLRAWPADRARNAVEGYTIPLYTTPQPIPEVDSEPVAYIFKHPAGRLFWALTDESNKGQSDVIPVYAAPQPAPVVPVVPVVPATLPCSVELKPGLIIGKGCKTETLLTALRRRADYNADIDAMTLEERAEHDASIKAFKAMLAAAPHDTPALNSLQSVDSVADTWIPVSERMPEERMSVILWDAEIGEVTSGHYSHKTQAFYHCGDAIENEITHWMVVAAPQEVK